MEEAGGGRPDDASAPAGHEVLRPQLGGSGNSVRGYSLSNSMLELQEVGAEEVRGSQRQFLAGLSSEAQGYGNRARTLKAWKGT